LAYGKTSPGSGLHKFLVRVYVLAAENHWFEDEDLDYYPAEFTRDLSKALLWNRPAANNRDLEVMKWYLCVDEGSEDLQESKIDKT
jgi:hypothetical protein